PPKTFNFARRCSLASSIGSYALTICRTPSSCSSSPLPSGVSFTLPAFTITSPACDRYSSIAASTSGSMFDFVACTSPSPPPPPAPAPASRPLPLPRPCQPTRPPTPPGLPQRPPRHQRKMSRDQPPRSLLCHLPSTGEDHRSPSVHSLSPHCNTKVPSTASHG